MVPELSLAYIHRDNIRNHYKHEATTITPEQQLIILLLIFCSQGVGVKSNVNEEGTESTLKGTWDWERESKIREVCEEMERWAIKARLGSS